MQDDLTALRPYLPALTAGIEALRARADDRQARCEAFGAEQASRAARELAGLREVLTGTLKGGCAS